jgi:hypothetical protein
MSPGVQGSFEQEMPCNIPEERKAELCRGGSLKYRTGGLRGQRTGQSQRLYLAYGNTDAEETQTYFQAPSGVHTHDRSV